MIRLIKSCEYTNCCQAFHLGAGQRATLLVLELKQNPAPLGAEVSVDLGLGIGRGTIKVLEVPMRLGDGLALNDQSMERCVPLQPSGPIRVRLCGMSPYTGALFAYKGPGI